MFLVDSNIIIYSFLPDYKYLRDLIVKNSVFVSEISRLEVLGYSKLTSEEESYFKDIFSFIPVIFPSKEIFDTAIELRKAYNLKLGDSIIGATALVHGLSIYSRNLKDLEKVKLLTCIDPVTNQAT